MSTNPTNAAKAAAIMHHISGSISPASAYALYDKLNDCETGEEMLDVLGEVGCPMWSVVEDLPPTNWWQIVECLAVCIDECRKELV